MTYTVTANWREGRNYCGSISPLLRTREEADRVYGEYLRAHPAAEVRLMEGEAVLLSAGRASDVCTTEDT